MRKFAAFTAVVALMCVTATRVRRDAVLLLLQRRIAEAGAGMKIAVGYGVEVSMCAQASPAKRGEVSHIDTDAEVTRLDGSETKSGKDHDFVERRFVGRQFYLARGVAVGFEQKGHNVGVLCVRQAPGRILWH